MGGRNYDEISKEYLGKPYPITQMPGPAAPEVRKWYKTHPGIDYGVPEGTPIIAPADLDILGTTSNDIYGNRIAVKDPYTGETMTFSHLKDLPTVSGRIKAGELLGYTGNTGRSTGPHLDVEIKNLSSNFNNMVTNNNQTSSGSGGLQINYDEINRFRNDMIKKGGKPEEIDNFLGKKISEIQKRQAEMQDYTNKAIITKEVAGDYKDPAVKLVQPPSTTPTVPSTTTTLPDIPQTGSDPNETMLKYNYQNAMNSGDLTTANKINDAYKSQYGTGINEERKLNASEQKKKDANDLKERMANTADSIVSLIDNYQLGKIDKKSYEQALNQLSSTYIVDAKNAAGMGGSLTGIELGIMAGGSPRQELRGPNIIDKMTGKIPAQTGKVLDKPELLRSKMVMAAEGLRGKKIDPIELSKTSSPSSNNKSNIIKNAGNDIKGILNGVLNLPKNVSDWTIKEVQDGKVVTPQTIVQYFGTEALKGQIKSWNEDFGRPLEGGDVLGRMGENFWNRPVSTLLDVIPGVAAVKALKGAKTLKTLDNVSDASKVGMLDDIPKVGMADKVSNVVSDIKTNVQGNAARNVTGATSNDLIGLEKLGKDIDYLTTANSNAGKARQLKAQQSKLRLVNDNFASKADEVVGELDHQKILDEVMNKVNSTDVARTNSKLTNIIKGDLSEILNAGPSKNGNNLFSTKPSTINKAREYLNKQIDDSWYKKDKPVTTKTDKLAYLRDTSSKTLREILANMDTTGSFGESLRLQHSAIEGYGKMSKKATKTTQPGGGFFTMAAKGARKISEVPGSAIGRVVIGKGSKLTTDVAKGNPIDYSGLVAPGKYLPSQPGSLPNIPQAGLEPPMEVSTNFGDVNPGIPMSTGLRPAPSFVLDTLRKAAKKGDITTSYNEFSKFYSLPEIGTFSKK